MANDRQPRNPYLVGLSVAGGIAGLLAVILATIAASLADETSQAVVDAALVVRLFAWADVLGLVAIVAIAAALTIAGVRWAPRVPAPSAPPSLGGDAEPPGGLTAAERRLLGRADAP